MIIKGRKREATFWANIFSTLRKKRLPNPNDQIPPAKTSLKQLIFTAFVAIFLCVFFRSLYDQQEPSNNY